MAEPEFHSAIVASIAAAGPDLAHVHVTAAGIGIDLAPSVPGQFVQMRVGEDKAYLAVASRAGQTDPLEFLVKNEGALGSYLTGVAPGSTVELTAAMGKGFPIEEHTGRDLVLFATGTGISALRPVIWLVADKRAQWNDVTLFFGARHPDGLAFREEFDDWRTAGINVETIVSRPEDAPWDGATGYVQDRFAELHTNVSNAIVLLCGVSDMHKDLTSILTEADVPAEHILTNY